MNEHKPPDQLPIPFYSLVIELKTGKRVNGYYVTGNEYWPRGWREDDGTYLDAERIRAWSYLTHEEEA